MTLSARRIALQGVGFAALALAVQGFAPLDQAVQAQALAQALALPGGVGAGGQISQSEWLRRPLWIRDRPREGVAQAAVGAVGADRTAVDTQGARKRRRAEEELLLILIA